MTIYRLNRVPDKTYIHFLNFIGEERHTAEPAMVPVTFALGGPGPIENSVQRPRSRLASKRATLP